MKTLASGKNWKLYAGRPRRAISRMWMGFVVFIVILFVYGWLQSFLTGIVGSITSPLGALSNIVVFLVIAFIAYWIYAWVIRRFGGEPEA